MNGGGDEDSIALPRDTSSSEHLRLCVGVDDEQGLDTRTLAPSSQCVLDHDDH